MSDASRSKSVMSPEKLNSLWIGYKESDNEEAKETLLLHYIYLVKWIVRRMMPRTNSYNEYDDYINSGIIGLIDAMDKFDINHGVKFETYAVARIRGEILDYMRAQDWASPSLRKKITAIDKAYEKYENAPNGSNTEKLVADELGMTVEQVQKVQTQTHMFNLMNFEEEISSPMANADSLCSDENTPEGSLIEKEKKVILTKLIDALSEKERLIISLYYYEGLLLKEIAEIMGVTESRVSQIHSRVLSKMRLQFNKAE